MSGRSPGRRLQRSVGSRLPASWRARLRQGLATRPGLALGRRLGLAGADLGLVTWVIVCEPADQERVGDCLASVTSQWHGPLEILVCPVGAVQIPPTGRDRRIRVLPATDTWYAAANAAAAEARGRHLGFVRGCDTLFAHATTDLAGALARSGSDVATGVLTQQGQAESWLERAQQTAHTVTATGVASLETPELASDLVIGNKLARREFWRRAGLAFGPHDDWLLSPAWAAALRAGARVDVLPVPVVRHAHEHGHRPFGARPSPLPALREWVEAVERIESLLGGTLLADGWRRHVLDVALPRFVADAERAEDVEWMALRELAERWSPPAQEPTPGVRAQSRALLWLAAADRRAGTEALAAEIEALDGDQRTELVGDTLLARWHSAPDDLPDHVRIVDPAESTLVAAVQRALRRPDAVAVDVFVRVQGLDLATEDLLITARLPDGSELRVEPRADPTIERWAQTRFQSAAAGSVRVIAPVAASAGAIRITVRAGRLERTGSVDYAVTAPSPAGRAIEVTRVGFAGPDLVVGLAPGTGSRARDLTLLGPTGGHIRATPAEDGGSVRFATSTDLYGRTVGLPVGRYRLSHPDGVHAGTALGESLPCEVVGERHRVRVAGDDGTLVLHLGPPLADDEIGAFNQQRLRDHYAAVIEPARSDLVYFDSYAGRSATDSPLAIFEELSRRRPELHLCWGISDHGQWAPPGAEPVLLRSRRWYDVLAGARALVTNTELEEWYVRRGDQYVLQTFHGYPSKAMGQGQWLARQLPPSRLAVMRKRSVETWDLILTPTPEMTRHYREQYGYRGQVHEHGYPRDDGLRAPEAESRREVTRRQLGIRPDQQVVLYAPTWRDHLATRPRAAARADFLDLASAARQLGDSHVLLVRGHRFHLPTGSSTGPVRSARIVDVTDHPEINDLILASDVAVLDYSSLRFDYAQTGRPMVFLVPDLASYSGGVRGFLFPFTDSAPGPRVSTTDEVVEQVRDVAALRARTAPALASFDARFNPWQDGRCSVRVVDRLLSLM